MRDWAEKMRTAMREYAWKDIQVAFVPFEKKIGPELVNIDVHNVLMMILFTTL